MRAYALGVNAYMVKLPHKCGVPCAVVVLAMRTPLSRAETGH